MSLITLTLPTAPGSSVFLRRWLPAGCPRGVVQIAHGLGEHGGRYDALAQELERSGFAVYAPDHRGHGGTAPSAVDLGFFAQRDGWRKCLDDLEKVHALIASAHEGLPLFLLGHSMGSFMARQSAGEGRLQLAGLILSGTYQQRRLDARAGALLARLERQRLGARGRSSVIHALTLGAYNRHVAPARTRFDWLSRDSAAVDRYAADPLCGFLPTTQLWIDLLDALAGGLPMPSADLPLYIMNGEEDPVCAIDPGARKLAASVRAAGVNRITQRIYAGARHELFHETNRDEVVHDLIAWLDETAAAP